MSVSAAIGTESEAGLLRIALDGLRAFTLAKLPKGEGVTLTLPLPDGVAAVAHDWEPVAIMDPEKGGEPTTPIVLKLPAFARPPASAKPPASATRPILGGDARNAGASSGTPIMSGSLARRANPANRLPDFGTRKGGK